MAKLFVMFSCILIAMVIVHLVDFERLESVYLKVSSDDILHWLMYRLVLSPHVWSLGNEERWDDSSATMETSGSDADENFKVVFFGLASIAH